MRRIDERFDRTPKIESSRNYDRDSRKAPLDGAPLVATKDMEFWCPAQHTTSFFQAKAASDLVKFKGVVIDNSGVAHRVNEGDTRALIGISLDTAITGENVRVLQVGVLPKGALPEELVLETGKNVYMSGTGELNSESDGILVGFMSEEDEFHLLMSGGAGSGGGGGGSGVPDGGNRGEVLTKLSGENGDAAWMPPTSVNGAMDYSVVGGIMRFPMIEPPEGWLRMDGSIITKTDYPDLWNAIGDVFLSHLDHPLDISFTGPQNGKYNVTASVSNTSYEAWRVFNYPGGKDPGINDKFWRSASTDAWIQLDFGEDNVIPCRFRIVSVNNIATNTGNVPASASGVGASTGPKKFKILGSKNGSDWADLTAELEHGLWGAREQFWCFCKENPARAKTYRYIRLHVLESHNPSFVEIGAFDIYFLYSGDVKENEYCVGNGGYFMGDIPDGERFVGAHEPNTFPYWLPGGLFRTQGAATGTNVNAATSYAGSASWEMFENGAGRAPSSYAPEHTHIPVFIRCKPAIYDGSGQSSLFVGKIEFFHELEAPEGWLYLNGSVLNNTSTAYPRLWEHLKNSPWKCCTEEQWQQMSSEAGGIGGVWRYVMDEAQNTLRLMDVRGDSVRFAGGKKDDTTYWQVGDWHPDATQHVTGEFAMWTGSYAPFVKSQYDSNPDGHAIGAFVKGGTVSQGINPSGSGSAGYRVGWDNARVARTADEERVRAGNLLPCVYTGNGSRGDVWGRGEGGGGGDISVTVKNKVLWGCSYYNDAALNSAHTYAKVAKVQLIKLEQDDPQWADVVDIHVDTENQCYVMPEDGVVAVEFRGSSINLNSNSSLAASNANSTAILTVRINDTDVVVEPAQQTNGRSYDARINAVVRVSKGDKISFYYKGDISGVGVNLSSLRTAVAYLTNFADVTATGGGGGGSGSGSPVEVKASTLWGSATKNGDMSLTASTWTRITALTDRKDFAAPIKLDSSGCFVAPKNGIILVNGGVEAGSTSGMTYVYTNCEIEHTDGSITSGYAGNLSRTPNGDVADSFSQVMPVVAGNKIWLTAYAAVAAPIQLSYLDISYLTPELDVSGGGGGGSGESGGGTGNVSLQTVRTENDYTAQNGDFVIAAAPVIITLTNLKDAKVDVKRMTKDGAITVRAESGSIDEYAEVYLYTNKETASFICDGENWYRA